MKAVVQEAMRREGIGQKRPRSASDGGPGSSRTPPSGGGSKWTKAKKVAMSDWTCTQWMRSLPGTEPFSTDGVLTAVATALLHSGDQDELEAVRQLGRGTREQLRTLLVESTLLDTLAGLLHAGATQLLKAAEDSHESKFQADMAQELSLGSLETFYQGLEGLLGSPSPELLQAATQEHCACADSDEWFTATNYGIRTTSHLEWLYVSDPPKGLEVMARLSSRTPLQSATPRAFKPSFG